MGKSRNRNRRQQKQEQRSVKGGIEFDIVPRSSTFSGVDINETNALNCITVYACIKVLAETMGLFPLITYERLKAGGRQRAYDHPNYRILHDQPNPEMSRVTFVETLQGHLGGWGNAYAEIQFNGDGTIAALWPLSPKDVTPFRNKQTGELLYKYKQDGGQDVIFTSSEILHIPGFGFDGTKGYSPIGMAKQGIALQIAMEQYAGSLFSNGASPGVIITHPKTLSPEGAKKLKNSIEQAHTGAGRAHKTMLLEEGMTASSLSMNPEDAQFLEGRQFQREEICSLFRVPPHLVGDLSRATFSNIEQQSLDFVQYSMLPWCSRWEAELNRKLYPEGDFYCEFLIDNLLRADAKSRNEALEIKFRNGVLTQDEWRALDNEAPLEDDMGKLHFVASNYTTVEQIVLALKKAEEQEAQPAPEPQPQEQPQEAQDTQEAEPQDNPEDQQDEPQDANQRAYSLLLDEATKRVVRKEIKAVEHAVGKYLQKSTGEWVNDKEGFRNALETFYQGQASYAQKEYAPVLRAFNRNENAEDLGREYANNSLGELLALVHSNPLDTAVSEIKKWLHTKEEESK